MFFYRGRLHIKFEVVHLCQSDLKRCDCCNHKLVRSRKSTGYHTSVGKMLNGKRYNRKKSSDIMLVNR